MSLVEKEALFSASFCDWQRITQPYDCIIYTELTRAPSGAKLTAKTGKPNPKPIVFIRVFTNDLFLANIASDHVLV